MDVTYCPVCGSFARPGASCRKGCAVAMVTGDMGEGIAQQSRWAAAQPSPAPVAPSPYSRRAIAAATATTTKRDSRPMWQRPCTCGHCMTCIGEG